MTELFSEDGILSRIAQLKSEVWELKIEIVLLETILEEEFGGN